MINYLENAQKLVTDSGGGLELGADRLGTSRLVKLMKSS